MLEIITITKFLLFRMEFIIDGGRGGGVYLIIGTYSYTLFYKQHFYEQRQAEMDKKIKQKLSNTLRLNCCDLKTIRFLHPRYHPKIVGDVQTRTNKCANFVLMR